MNTTQIYFDSKFKVSTSKENIVTIEWKNKKGISNASRKPTYNLKVEKSSQLHKLDKIINEIIYMNQEDFFKFCKVNN